ncbi:acyl carrier protein [Streptomyces sp. SID5910]|uniref:acyl carrier protein n=1 Tax=Streptomyces sp. SID5910 TaxID=2690312 RepID=UPI00136DEDC7|nr:acyl carrier protein [Streptomyces sp. SID5910]MYR44439.1 acyl carrier protein [Streptomyces sp. SID5910]
MTQSPITTGGHTAPDGPGREAPAGVRRRIAAVLTGQFKVPAESVQPHTTLREMKFDSLVLIELGLVLDKEFSVAIDDGELSDAFTLEELAAFVAGKQADA